MADSSNLFRRALMRRVTVPEPESSPSGATPRSSVEVARDPQGRGSLAARRVAPTAPTVPRLEGFAANAGRYVVVHESQPAPPLAKLERAPRRFALVVEDDDVVRDGITTVLDDAGFTVVETATLDRARALLDAMRPSVLVLDFNLAGEYASVLLDELRHRRCATPILLVSASPLAIDAARAYGVELLPKPFEIDALVARVERLAARPPSDRPATAATGR